MATFGAALSRDGPGLLLRDIDRGDTQARAAAQVVAAAAPDILLLTDFDYDYEGRALEAFAQMVAEAGHPLPHRFARRPNAGMATGLDLDGDGRRGEAEDAQGWGRFAGDGGMAILSRHPIDAAASRDFSDLPWAELPDSLAPGADLSAEALDAQRLSSNGHWAVTLRPEGAAPITLLVFDATPPVFDGPEDRNGRRNADEIRFWRLFLDGAFGSPPGDRFVLLGNANLDPVDGEGRHDAIRALLADPRLQDPRPMSGGGRAAANPEHRGDPALDTADWDDPVPGNLRVDYVLPSADWRVTGAGVVWPEAGPLRAAVEAAGRHRLVWADIAPEG
ncbi:endonuclease/exonuclease/phosphatase family protein [Rhodosalinus halophilus]|uniref:endonuclease/exonuclease/phosphatase family protein n=1 Tax=Rhodosalinus halophilus TaxID=2259333 RepID=UPI001F1FB438|nr:endonuclease/exonuclease/phosphatase family protein [Rhodosalinus halophilus]